MTAPAMPRPDATNGWLVHVIGPDDIHQVPDKQAAINLAHRINTRLRNTANYYGADNTTYGWAVPVPPGHQASLEPKQ